MGEQHHLEKQQWIAFRIITRSFLENHVNRLASKKINPLRMLLTGPGGVSPGGRYYCAVHNTKNKRRERRNERCMRSYLVKANS